MQQSPVTPQQAAVELLRRRNARRDLRAFAHAVDVPGKPVSDNPDEWIFSPIETTIAPHHNLLMQSIQSAMETPYGRLMIFCPPGSAKSTYSSVVAATWYLGKNPGHKIILASYGSDLARRHGRRARQIVKQRAYKGVFGAGISAETSAADEWALDNGSEYLAGGILSGITGNRANGILIDDPVKGRDEADSEVIQKKTLEAYQDDLLTRLLPGGWVILIQTRWNEKDLAGQLLPDNWSGESGLIECRDGMIWNVLCLQAQCERSDDPLGRKIGEYLWPEWFTDRHWDMFKSQPRTWSALYQQVPSPDDGDYFKREWFKRFKKPPKNLRIYGASDYAVTPGGGDWTEHGIFGVDKDYNVYILDWWSGQTSADTWIETQLDLIQQWEPLAWIGESGPIRRAVEPFLLRRSRERKIYCHFRWLSSISDKAVRARAFQAMAASGMVSIMDGELGDRVISQLLRFLVGSVDDKVDTCSLIGRYLDKIRNAGEITEVRSPPKEGTAAHLLLVTDEPENTQPYRNVRPK